MNRSRFRVHFLFSIEFSMGLWSECVCIVDSWERQPQSAKQKQKNWKKIRSNRPLIRPVCARIGLWSDKFALKTASGQTVPDRRDLWSDKIQTIVQTKVRSKSSPDHVIRAHREHVCAQRWSDQRSLRSGHLDLGDRGCLIIIIFKLRTRNYQLKYFWQNRGFVYLV